MDKDGFQIPTESLRQNLSPSPPPPELLHTTKKRKRNECNDVSLENNNSKRRKLSHRSSSIYSCPEWSELPASTYKFELEVIKNGVSLQKIGLNNKSHHIFGRDAESVDILTLHPSCSRNHAVLQHRKNGQWFLFDFGSTHHTKLNHKKLRPHKYYKIEIGDIIKFGSSERMYILNGPKELEKNLEPTISTKMSIKTTINNDNNNKNQSMESMINELAKRSKYEKIKNKKQKKTSKINIWGIDDDDDRYLNNNEFDENEAKQNEDTKELYKSLELKRKQHQKMENKLKESLSKQRSDKELDQMQCIKIERFRSKINNLEDDIDSISTKIAQRLRGNNDIYNDNGDNLRYFDHDTFDDDDDFYDRIKTIHRKKNDKEIKHRHALSRNARIINNNKEKEIRDYDSYKDELDNLEMKISEIEQTLRDIQYRKNINITDKEKLEKKEDIDSILIDLKANDNKYNVLKRELDELEIKKETALKMSNLLRPAYFKIMENEPERLKSMKSISCKYSPNNKSSISSQIKPGSLADIAQKMKNQEIKKQKYEEKIQKEAKQRLMEREEEIKKIENERIMTMKKFEEEQKKKMEEKRKKLKLRDEETKNKVGLIIYDKDDDDDDDKQRNNNKLESEFAAIFDDNNDNIKNTMNNENDTDFIKDADAQWIPPQNQSGDGKTWLNQKFGY